MQQIVVVGPCAAGKTTLVTWLREAGFPARAVAQEHSAVRGLWKHGGTPECLIYLDAELESIIARGRIGFPKWLLDEQQRRLHDARQAAHLYLPTDALSVEDVRESVRAFLRERLTLQPQPH